MTGRDLEFLREDQVPATEMPLVARARGWPLLIMFLVTAPISVAALAVPFVMTGVSGLENVILYGLAVMIGLPMALMAWLSLRSFRATLRPSNWVLQAGDDGLYVKFRSPYNHHLPPDDSVVLFIPRLAVGWLRAHRRKSWWLGSEPGHEHATRESYLEIKLKQQDTADLARRLTEERQRRVGWTAGDAPLRVLGEDLLRVAWHTHRGSLTPKIDQTIRFLARTYAINLPETSTGAKAAELDSAAQEARLLELVERGERIQAVKLARRLYGFDTTEAHRFVKGLVE
jgi:hypothetical protein